MSVERPKGPWTVRVAVRVFTLIFGLLVFWLLGFVLDDLRRAKGPSWETVEQQHVDQALLERSKTQQEELAALERQIADRQEARQVLSETSHNLQQTIGQLTELERLGLEKGADRSGADRGRFDETLALFLDNQRQAQERSREIVELVGRKQALQEAIRGTEASIEAQREPARAAFARATERHRLKLATVQLALLLPLLAAAAWLFRSRRESRFFPLVLAFGVAVLVHVFLVIHGYFPSRYYKYILTSSLLAVVTRLLIGLIRSEHEPPLAQRLGRFREGYERFLCPICEYPIRTGPRRFLFWTRRTVGKALAGAPPGETSEPEAYTCPSCGTALFEPCPSCQHVRHALLGHCEHCGVEKDLSGG